MIYIKRMNIVNFVNFVRGEDPRNQGTELYDTFREQVALCRRYDMPYTFLFQYDAMVKPAFVELLLEYPDPNCEIGVWIEMAQEQVEKCGLE